MQPAPFPFPSIDKILVLTWICGPPVVTPSLPLLPPPPNGGDWHFDKKAQEVLCTKGAEEKIFC